jgi:hypothetical protein
MKSLAELLSSKSNSSEDAQSVTSSLSSSSKRNDTQGTLKREGITPIRSSSSSSLQRKLSSSSNSIDGDSNKPKLLLSPFLDKSKWLNLNEGWHQITVSGSGNITRCGLYSVIESHGTNKTYGIMYIPRSDAAYNAAMCNKPEYDLSLQFKIHYKYNSTITPQFELLFGYKDNHSYLSLHCDALLKNWSLIHHNGGREICLSQINDNSIKTNCFYSILIQIRINCVSIDINGIPVFTKLKVSSVSDLSGFMGLKAHVIGLLSSFLSFFFFFC